MKIILTHILRNIKEKKGRSLLIILSLTITSIVFILNLTIPNQIVESNINRMTDIIGLSDLLLASYDEFDINNLKLNKEKINYVGVNDLYIIHKEKTFVIYGTDINKASDIKLINNVNLLDDEIIISKTTADKYNYKVNDIMSVDFGDNIYDFKIKEVVDNKGLMYFKTLSGVVNINTYNKLLGRSLNDYRTYYIDVLDNDNIDMVKSFIKDNNKEYLIEDLVDEEVIKKDNSYIQLILVIIFIMAMIMIFFVINTLNKMIILERMPVIGTFRSIGASKKKMNLLLILENSIYGFIGGMLGSVVSLLINSFSIKLLLGGTSIDTEMPIENLIFGIIFTVILEILMSLSAIIKSNKYSIKEIMFENKNTKSNVSLVSSIISVLLIIISILLYLFTSDSNVILDLLALIIYWIGIAYFIPVLIVILSKIICFVGKKFNLGSLLMAGKNLRYNKLLVSSIRLVVISTSIMLVIINVSSTFNKMLDSFSIQFGEYDIFVENLSKKYSEYDKLNDLYNVEKIDYVFMSSIEGNITYNDGKKFDINPMILGMSHSREDIEELNYKIRDLKNNEVLFDEVFLKNNYLNIGDKIKLYVKSTDKYIDVVIKGTVNSFYQSIQREVIVINDDVFKEKISEVPHQIIISVKDKGELNDTVDNIERELKDSDITIMTVDDFVKMQRENINTIMSLFYIIIFFAVVLSFVGIINNQLISFIERTKEFAVLNSICMSKKQLNKMLIVENIISNLVACIFGFIVSVISVILMARVMNGIKMYINLGFNYEIGLIIIGIIFVVLLITVIVPIRRLKNINIVESIKYE